MTNVIGLPSLGLACPVQCWHMELGSGFRGPEIPLHFLWTQLEQPPWSLCWRGWNTWQRGPWRSSEAHQARPIYQNHGFAHVDPKSLSFHCNLPENQLLLHSPQQFSDDDQVICIQVVTRTSYILHDTRGRMFQERWWTVGAQAIALVNIHIYTEIFNWVENAIKLFDVDECGCY